DTSRGSRLTEEDVRLLINVKISEGPAWPHKLGHLLRGKNNLYDQPPSTYEALRAMATRISPNKMRTLTLRQLRQM
ncbi:hypothetical protein L0N33_24410, partial [Roseburia faecis]|nr:hypothetical protein [Roseburia faecis]